MRWFKAYADRVETWWFDIHFAESIEEALAHIEAVDRAAEARLRKSS